MMTKNEERKYTQALMREVVEWELPHLDMKLIPHDDGKTEVTFCRFIQFSWWANDLTFVCHICQNAYEKAIGKERFNQLTEDEKRTTIMALVRKCYKKYFPKENIEIDDEWLRINYNAINERWLPCSITGKVRKDDLEQLVNKINARIYAYDQNQHSSEAQVQ